MQRMNMFEGDGLLLCNRMHVVTTNRLVVEKSVPD